MCTTFTQDDSAFLYVQLRDQRRRTTVLPLAGLQGGAPNAGIVPLAALDRSESRGAFRGLKRLRRRWPLLQ